MNEVQLCGNFLNSFAMPPVATTWLVTCDPLTNCRRYRWVNDWDPNLNLLLGVDYSQEMITVVNTVQDIIRVALFLVGDAYCNPGITEIRQLSESIQAHVGVFRPKQDSEGAYLLLDVKKEVGVRHLKLFFFRSNGEQIIIFEKRFEHRLDR